RWNVASVTSITATPPPPDRGPPPPVGGATAPACAGTGAEPAGGVAGRSEPRSTAPRVKIDGVVRGSLMVASFARRTAGHSRPGEQSHPLGGYVEVGRRVGQPQVGHGLA